MQVTQKRTTTKASDPHIRLIFTEDDNLVRFSIKFFIEQKKSATIREFDKGEDTIAYFKTLAPGSMDLILLDINLPDISGLKVVDEIRKLDTDIPILILTSRCTEEEIFLSANKGANGIIFKAASEKEFLHAIESVLTNGYYMDPRIQNNLSIEENPLEDAFDDMVAKYDLTKRQIQIIELIVKGYTSEQIANQLHLSVRTIHGHRERIRNKLNVGDRAELIKIAHLLGID